MVDISDEIKAGVGYYVEGEDMEFEINGNIHHLPALSFNEGSLKRQLSDIDDRAKQSIGTFQAMMHFRPVRDPHTDLLWTIKRTTRNNIIRGINN